MTTSIKPKGQEEYFPALSLVAQLIAQSLLPKWLVAQTSALPGLSRLLVLLLLLLLTMHEDAAVCSLATATVPVEDEFGWTTSCAMATKVSLSLVITVRGALTTVVTVKMSPSRVCQV